MVNWTYNDLKQILIENNFYSEGCIEKTLEKSYLGPFPEKGLSDSGLVYLTKKNNKRIRKRLTYP